MALIPLSRPDVSAHEKRLVLRVLDSQRLAMGPYLQAFEAHMAAVCGTRHAVAVSSGTAALHLIVRALGLGEGDAVLTTPYSFVASSNALLFERIVPRFVDIDPVTYNLDVAQVEAALTPNTRAILAVDVFGYPLDWPALEAVARKHNLLLIDDACEALGATVGGRAVGSWGHAAAFGFYPNKQITTGEGGCITTDDEELAMLCRSMRNQGRGDDRFMEHIRLGYNYRMSELSAALGCAQLDRFDEIKQRRGRVAAWYREALAPLTDDLVLPPDPGDVERSWFVYVVRLKDPYPDDARDVLMGHLLKAGVECAPYFPSIHLQPYYRERFGFRPGLFPVSEAAAARTLALPFFTGITREQVDTVAGALKAGLARLPVASVYARG